ncbi:flagellar hook-basal body protein [Calderihabitans maritimus]|uniref:Flagellar basal-body rod protein FlgF n=1 Tax=Calderihabitans maritimus TaxID=1246530 RepID=A0A1Z5HTS8_9FIRM|nr:flagellar hook-basal body protein [Calderihabitans maritimus]GAW92943.1 flagellar basal-body rod protein FlgF [Calderihabitans maritimus]
MIRGIYIAASGMAAQEIKHDVISHNLANASTPGYKKDRVVYSSFSETLLYHVEANAGKKEIKVVGNLSPGALVDQVVTDYQKGIGEETGNPFHLALVGDGFFTVERKGEIRYTRNGTFQLDGEGFLVTPEGFYLLGEKGRLQVGARDFVVTERGEVMIDGETIDRLRITDFEDYRYLKKVGHTLFIEEPGAIRIKAEPVQLRQGYLEKANLNLITEMIDMIQALRTYETNQKMIQAHDEALGKAVNEIGTLR